MRKIIITFLIVSVFAGISAQSYTQVFDSVFQHVDLSHTSTGILYERVLPFSNLVSYVTNIPHPTDTCDYWQFVMAYDELYRAGARNTFLSDSLEGVLRNLPVDTSSVVFGIMHANFNTFDTAAMRQRLYFDADSILWENTSVNVCRDGVHTVSTRETRKPHYRVTPKNVFSPSENNHQQIAI